ncbi:MAG: HAD family phosphatase [Proteiniphilum sp.]|nr:HAD family phosphatase [Proteiniphilum sp.]
MHITDFNTILFDMDGVVIDSEKLHLKAMDLSLESNNIVYDNSILNDFVGRSDESFFQYIFDNFDSSVDVDKLLKDKNSFFEELLKGMQYVEGFTDFIKVTNQKNIKAGLVTSSSQFTIKKVDEILNLTPYFKVIVAEEDTQKHKPHPDPYLLGLMKFDADETKTLIIEDSVNGIISGKAAGCVVAGLTTSFNSQVLLDAGADFVVDSYTELQEIINL